MYVHALIPDCPLLILISRSADELSMHLLITPLIYRLLAFKASPRYTKLLGVVLCTLFTTVMVTHMVLDEFLLHASTFGLGVYIIQMRISKIIGQVSSPAVNRVLPQVARLGLRKFSRSESRAMLT